MLILMLKTNKCVVTCTINNIDSESEHKFALQVKVEGRRRWVSLTIPRCKQISQTPLEPIDKSIEKRAKKKLHREHREYS